MKEEISHWFEENKEEAEKFNINVTSPASHCSIELYNDTMSAYRVKF